MPERRGGEQGPMRGPGHVPQRPPRPPARPSALPAQGVAPDQVQRFARLAGNKAARSLVGPSPGTGTDHDAVHRVEVDLGTKGETIYERPNMKPGGVPIVNPTSGQKDFEATRYVMRPKYQMDRTASAVNVEVRIMFLDQARGTSQFAKDKKGNFLTDKKGNKVPDPTYRRNVGPIKKITDAARITFARQQCNAISGIWSGKYLLQGNETQVLGGYLDEVPLIGDLVRPKKAPIKLDLNFKAVPVFDPGASNAHTKVRLFGNKVVAKRSGAHPIDAGHWYMNTKANYGGANITAISAHEYGHLLGLHDEYSRSNDQVHQQLHLMGGEARKSQKKLDAHTTRQMIAMALYPPIKAGMSSNLAKVDAAILGASGLLQSQLSAALRNVWRDASVRSAMVAQIAPALKAPNVKRALADVVSFQTAKNFSNLTVAKSSIGAFTAKVIDSAVMGEMRDWYSGVMNEVFEVQGADKTKTSFSTSYSANFRQAAKATAGTKAGNVVQSVVGASIGVPTLPASPNLVGQLESLPAHWKTPGKGLDSAYTPAVATTQVGNSIKTAVAAKLFDPVTTTGALYRPVYDLVQNAAAKSAAQAVNDFVDTSVRQKVRGHLATVRKSIDTEVQAALGMTAGKAAVKSADPDMKAVANKYLGMLQSQQNKKQWKQTAIINPGGGSGDVDVKYTASSIMGNNNPAKSGFRTDMIAPVVGEFNDRLTRFNESKFVAKKAP